MTDATEHGEAGVGYHLIPHFSDSIVSIGVRYSLAIAWKS